MITRRSVLSAAGAALIAEPLVLSGAAWAQGTSAAGPKLHALLVGINTYAGSIIPPGGREPLPIRPLRGCLNDVALLEAAVKPLAASPPVVLREAQATKQSVMAAWRSILARTTAGDTLLFTFSGHGARYRKTPRPGQPIDYHRTLVFAGFNSRTGLDGLSNDEIRTLFAEATAKGVRVLFVADCCHAGYAVRSATDDASDYRTVTASGEIDLAAELGADLKRVEAQVPPRPIPPNTVTFAACTDEQRVKEITDGGRKHGALSVAFARALTGFAGSRGDGGVTVEALDSYVFAQVKNLADSAQSPHVLGPVPGGNGGLTRGDVLFTVKATPPPGAGTGAAAARRSVRLALEGVAANDAAQIISKLPDVALASSRVDADLTWVAASGDCIESSERIASGVKADALQPVVDRVRALDALKRLTIARDSLKLRLLLPGENPTEPPRREANACHSGKNLSCLVDGLAHPNLVMLVISGTGVVDQLFPGTKESGAVGTGRPYTVRGIYAKEPWGSDHIVAIAAASDAQLAAFSAVQGTSRPLAVIDAITNAAASGPVQIGFQGIFTCPG